uniref:RRM domain-containing protein n=1 Tax=Haemonchus contortus TaxID=6289 RepID=A0A7I4YMZ4_HAECO
KGEEYMHQKNDEQKKEFKKKLAMLGETTCRSACVRVKEEEPDWTTTNSAPVIQVKTEVIDQPQPIVEENGSAPGQTEPAIFRKIFVGSLTGTTTIEVLREFYLQFGELTDVVVVRDPNTKRSRGFGFVTFACIASVDAAIAARPHVIDGKTVDSKRAMPRDNKDRDITNVSTKRLYVRGIREDHTEEMLTEYFGKYGNVVKSEIFLDKYTNKPRGFAFVTFDDNDPVDQCVLVGIHKINGFTCMVKKGLSKEEMNKIAQKARDRMYRMSRSRGDTRGGWPGDWGGQVCGCYGQQGGYGYGGPPLRDYGQQRYEGYGQRQGWGDPAGWGQQAGGWAGPPYGQQQWISAQGGGRYWPSDFRFSPCPCCGVPLCV